MGRRNQVDVDLDGLAKLVNHRKARLGMELASNGMDPKDATQINITLEKVTDDRDRAYRLRVVDNSPTGFIDLSHAYTLFVDSTKKDDPDSIGMFNMGEKLIIAVSKTVTIVTTSGGVRFDDSGRHRLNKKTDIGSDVEAIMTLTQEQFNEMTRLFKMIIPKPDQTITFNGEEIPHRQPLKEFDMQLITPLAATIADDIQYVKRVCKVGIYEVLPGEEPSLYDHSIPVVPNGSDWHYVVHQKVPVPFDRDNAPPSYLNKLHVECVNQMHNYIKPEQVNKTFVKVALEDDNIKPEAFHDLRVKKYGDKVVIHDPNFPEASKRAMAAGHVVLYGRSESSGFYQNNRRFNEMQTAQEVTPQDIPFSPGGRELRLLDPEKMTAGMRLYEQFARMIFTNVVEPGHTCGVTWANDSKWPYAATFGSTGLGGSRLTINVGRLGYKWFDRTPADTTEMIDLLIHEFAHYGNPNPSLDDHLSASYHERCTRLGASLLVYALEHHKAFRKFRSSKLERANT